MKRGIVNGFDGITGKETAKRIKNWNKNQPSGKRRSIKQIRIKYTYNLQTWYYEEKTYTQKFICTLGMMKYMKKVLKDQKLFHCFDVFPNAVKESFSFTTGADYNHDKLKIQYKDEGDKGYGNFYVLFCSTCSKDKYPDLSKNSKIICLKTQRLRTFRNIGMNSSLLIAQLPKIMIPVDVSSQMTPPFSQALTTDELFFV